MQDDNINILNVLISNVSNIEDEDTRARSLMIGMHLFDMISVKMLIEKHPGVTDEAKRDIMLLFERIVTNYMGTILDTPLETV